MLHGQNRVSIYGYVLFLKGDILKMKSGVNVNLVLKVFLLLTEFIAEFTIL